MVFLPYSPTSPLWSSLLVKPEYQAVLLDVSARESVISLLWITTSIIAVLWFGFNWFFYARSQNYIGKALLIGLILSPITFWELRQQFWGWSALFAFNTLLNGYFWWKWRSLKNLK